LGFENSNLYSCIKDVMVFLGDNSLRGGKRIKGVVIFSDDLLPEGSHLFWYNLAFSRGVVFYYHNDHLNTPVKMSDEKGNIVWEVVDKHPFGEFEVKGKTVNLSDYGGVESWSYTVENPLRFPGQYNDYNYRSVVISGKKGPYYNYHRWYNPDIGRYMEVDPYLISNFDLLGGLVFNQLCENKYLYSSNNPAFFFDQLGYEKGPVYKCGFIPPSCVEKIYIDNTDQWCTDHQPKNPWRKDCWLKQCMLWAGTARGKVPECPKKCEEY